MLIAKNVDCHSIGHIYHLVSQFDILLRASSLNGWTSQDLCFSYPLWLCKNFRFLVLLVLYSSALFQFSQILETLKR